MPLSTSSSENNPSDTARLERPVAPLSYALWLALLVFFGGMAAWEWQHRALGVPQGDYRNSDSLWAETRRRVDNGEGGGWVFIGSSRLLFNVQVSTWTELDGRPPVQLAMQGSSPIIPLESLAEDPDFTGKLMIGVAPGLFFSGYAGRGDAFERYESETPTQWFGHQVSKLFEPHLAFYDYYFALPNILSRQRWPERDGVPQGLEIPKISVNDVNRDTQLWSRVERDQEFQDFIKQAWADGWEPMAERPEEDQVKNVETRNKQIERAVVAVDKIRAKGGEVVFVHMPVSGHYAIAIPDEHPREQAWDVLIEKTGAPGLHYEDHEEMQGYWLPEWSHMSASEALRFTAEFYPLVMRELAAHQAAGTDK